MKKLVLLVLGLFIIGCDNSTESTVSKGICIYNFPPPPNEFGCLNNIDIETCLSATYDQQEIENILPADTNLLPDSLSHSNNYSNCKEFCSDLPNFQTLLPYYQTRDYVCREIDYELCEGSCQ
tara:strand:- start:78 stop:446 length:369 start_codon:yes stop_codon:yes gene_type:complete